MQQVCFRFLSVFFLCISMLGLGKSFARENPIKNSLQIEENLNDEEAFLVRRIAEFWKDGDYGIVKNQIKSFLTKYPHSPSGDMLNGILGDLYLQEKKYENALEVYNLISAGDVREKILLNKFQCYYELKNFSSLAGEAVPYISNQPECFNKRLDEFHFLVAEAFFHQAFETDDLALKEEFLELSEPHYEELLNTSYADTALFSIAEVNRLLNRSKKASEIYQELATRYPKDQEELHFQMASMQALFDKNLAIESFGKIVESKGNRAVEASFNQMILYFQLDQFQNVLDLETDLISAISDEHKPLFHYMVGKSCFSLDQHQNAISHIKNYLEFSPEEGPVLKNALLIMMTSSAKTENAALFDQTLETFTKQFAYDDELPKALFMHALLCKEQGNFSLMGQRLEMILEKYPEFEDREGLLFEYGIFCHEQQRWRDCYNTFNDYLSNFSTSSRDTEARKFFISASLHLLKSNQDEETPSYSISQLSLDLDKALKGDTKLSAKEKGQYNLLYAKALFSVEKYKECLEILSSIEDDPSDANFMAELNYLNAQAHHELSDDPEAFYASMEKAISLNPDLAENSAVHLQLYNAYLSQIQKLEGRKTATESIAEEKQQLFDHAATHLYTAYMKSTEHLKLENRLWLANYFYNKTKQSENFDPTGENFLTSMAIYKKILFSEETGEFSEITPDNLFFEQEAVKYIRLLGYQNNYVEKIQVLKNLLEKQNAYPEWNWKKKNEVLLELATAYEVQDDLENALETYSFLQNAGEQGFSPLAKFHASKIRFFLLDQDEQNENNEIVQNVLFDLKELQIRKNPLSEPLHLEAALEYAKIRAAISDKENQNNRYLFFLNRLKEDYEASDDPIMQSYNEKLSDLPEKKALYENYMRFIDAEKLLTQAKIKFSEKGLLEAEELNSQALAILSELVKQGGYDSGFQKRLKQSIEEINALDAYN